MTFWARLTWQAADPAALADDLARRLGVQPVPAAADDGSVVLGLATADVELVRWRRESPSDDPQPGGRLLFEPAPGGAAEPVPPADPQLVLVGVGWATVELDRAEAELAEWLGGPSDAAGDGPEPHLGARARPRAADGLPGRSIVLLEPATEGRLAASLARDGEGPCALYVWPPGGLEAWVAAARRRGVVTGVAADGPFGASVPVPGAGGSAGPHLLVVAASEARTAGTIGP